MSSPSGKGFFLSAPPDTGKTTTVIKCVKQGYYFLSDDMTIINLPNNAVCFPKSMTISAHTYKTAVEAQSAHNYDNDDVNMKSVMSDHNMTSSFTD